MSSPLIRAARIDDAAAINRIYNHYIRHSAITFDIEPWSIERRRDWLAGFIDGDDGDGDARDGDGDNDDGGDNNGGDNGDGDNNGGDNGRGDDGDIYHALVAEIDGTVAGFAFNHAFRAKPAYRRATETTVYAAADHQARGVGGALYAELFRRIESTDLHRAYAVIALPNPRSIALHRRFGFTRIATFSEVGYKFNKYIDAAWFEKALK